MPKLDLITAPAGTSPDKLLDVRRMRAPDIGAGAIAEAAQKAAGTFAAAQQETLKEDIRREERDAKLWQLSTLSEDRSKWTARLKELQDAAPEGAPNFGEQVRKEFDDYRQQASKAAPPIIRKEYEARLLDLGAELGGKADIYQGTAKVAKQVRNYEAGLNADANTLLSDPSQFDAVLGLRMSILDETDIPAEKKANLRRNAENALAAATVSSMAMTNPKEALASLKAGEWDRYLDADKKLALLRQVDTAAKVGKAEARELLQDHVASLRATGVGVPGAMEKVAQAYEGDDLARIQKDVSLAQRFFNANQQILYAQPGDMAATLDSFKPKPGQVNFADQQQQYAELVRSAQTIIKQRSDDPAGFAASMPQVKQQVREDGPDATRLGVRSNLAGQEAMGIPAVNQRVLSKSQAQAITSDLMSKPVSQRGAAILQLQERYREYFPQAMKDLSDKSFSGLGLDPRTMVLADVAGNPALAQQLGTVLETGSKELRDGLDRANVTDAEKGVREALAPWMQTVRNGAFGAEREPMLNGIAAAVEDLAISYVRNGEAPATAAERAANAVINDRFIVQDTYYIPREAPDGLPLFPGSISGYLDKQKSRAALEAAGVRAFGDGPSFRPTDGPLGADVDAVLQRYPALRGGEWQIVDSRGKGQSDGRQIEFYPPDESDNPRPGRPTIEVFNPSLTGESLRSAIFGDMLHHQPAVDPKFAKMRADFAKTITPEQKRVDQNAYQRARQEGETRSFEQWFEVSRLDAYIRGYIAPDSADEWRKSGMYTQEQTSQLDVMMSHLRSASASPTGSMKNAALERDRTLRTAETSGYWVTNANGTGAYLMLPFRGGGALPLLRADGSRYEFSFREASDKGMPKDVPADFGPSP